MIVRIAKRPRGFTQIDNRTLRDDRLSLKARGLLAYLLSQPSFYTVRSEDLAGITPKEGRDAIRAALAELEAAGYVRRIRTRNDAGRWSTETHVFERPEDASAPTSWVYYVRREDGAIKIGASRNPKGRARRAGGTLIAVEAGYFDVEKERHAQFSEHRLDGEWFAPAEELLDHVAMLAPEPMPDNPVSDVTSDDGGIDAGRTDDGSADDGSSGAKDKHALSKTEDEDLAAPPPKRPRARDRVFDAIATVCRMNLEGLTRSEASAIGKAKREIREAWIDQRGTGPPSDRGLVMDDAEVERLSEEILARGREAWRRWRGAPFSPAALTKHWSSLGTPAPRVSGNGKPNVSDAWDDVRAAIEGGRDA